MGSLAVAPFLSSKPGNSLFDQNNSIFPSSKKLMRMNQSISPVARLFGPSIFEASKLKVLFLGVDEKKHPGNLPRTYTLTHSDITAKLTLAISQTINNSQLQGWSNKLYRDEVVAEWKKVKGDMSLHVHCHISGGHFLLDWFCRLRYLIFRRELPVVLKAFFHGDGNFLSSYPELQEALVWVYFHSNIPEFSKVECWGPLKDAAAPSTTETGGSHDSKELASQSSNGDLPEPCQDNCTCCFPPMSLIPWSKMVPLENKNNPSTQESLQQP
ncbi:protein STAY-GREEN [Salix suchowensis]|uniref:PROTEIN STAY-GREEN 1 CHLOROPLASTIC n=1 Tax=Salix koriyanagi TaxID=2511006 RepID=A0A9Q0Q8K8_9ROSI|nr:protein STAY-GREEN [Salix suchowensis]KAJ6701624.1 PROTEIN STAY-GREEN 1 CHLOROPLASTIC [Salix koriyanagi]